MKKPFFHIRSDFKSVFPTMENHPDTQPHESQASWFWISWSFNPGVDCPRLFNVYPHHDTHTHHPNPVEPSRMLALCLRWLTALAWSQSWPTKQAFKLVVVFPPGGSADQVARIIAPALAHQPMTTPLRWCSTPMG
jgi:hypothetical protein